MVPWYQEPFLWSTVPSGHHIVSQSGIILPLWVKYAKPKLSFPRQNPAVFMHVFMPPAVGWGIIYIYIYMYIYIYIYIMVVDQNSFIPERPLFANKKITFAKLSRTPCLSFAGPMLANNTSYEDSFTTCQIAPENHGSLLGSLLNIQLASRNPFSGQIFFAKFTGPPPSTCTLTFARSFA